MIYDDSKLIVTRMVNKFPALYGNLSPIKIFIGLSAKAATVEAAAIIIILLLLVFSPWAGTRAQSGDRYSSGTVHSRHVLRGSLPLLSPAFRHSHSRRQMPPRPQQRKRS
jgi:hypothetical protein